MFRKISVAAFFLMFVLGAQEGRTTSPPTEAQLGAALPVYLNKCQHPQLDQCYLYVQAIAQGISQCISESSWATASYGQCIQPFMSQVQYLVSSQQKGCPSLSLGDLPGSCRGEVKRSCPPPFNSSDFNTCALKKLASDSNCSAYVPCFTNWEIPLQFLQQFA